MQQKYLLYLSTNDSWGGSEILWTHSAKMLAEKGYLVKGGAYYEYSFVKEYIVTEQNYFNLHKRFKLPSIPLRTLQKLRMGKFPRRDLFLEQLQRHKPDLVIISQGTNIAAMEFMKDCALLNIPCISITHLVTEYFWQLLNDEVIDELKVLYRYAKRNYFVSQGTLGLQEKLIGFPIDNAAIVYNPFTKAIPSDISYPIVENDTYAMALIGRVETFHKGYDLLVDVLKNDKWKKRSVRFSVFGKGPHINILKRLIEQNNITSVCFQGHVENVADVWRTHHILLMPSRMEGQSLSLIEAMRFQRAAIVTDVGGTSELIEEGINGFIAEHATPDAIDAAMERAWEKRTEWQQFGENAAKSIVEKHPPDPLAKFHEEIEGILSNDII